MTAIITRPAAVAALGFILAAAPIAAQQTDDGRPRPAATDPISLGDAARLAAGRAPSAVGARARAFQGDARVAQVRSEFLPQLGTEATMDGGPEATSLPTGTYLGGAPRMVSERTVDLRLQATQRLFDLPTLRRLRATSTEADAIAHSAVAAEEQAATRGALAYLELQRADARVAARLADSSLAAELLGIARQQLNAGTAIALDVTRAESQLASIVSQLIAARSARARAELELHHALALPLRSPLQLADSLRAPGGEEATDEQAAIQTAMNRRGDLLSAGTHAEAARREIGAVKAERLPVVQLFSSAASTRDGVFDNRAYGISVSLNLFDGFRRDARVAEYRAREREADAEWQDLKLRIEVDVRGALVDLAAAREQVIAADLQLRLAEQEVEQARERFRAGVAGNADVIQASLTLNHARDIVVDARTTWHQARVRLAAAQGIVTEIS